MKSSARSSSLRIFLSTLSLRRATYRPGCRAAAAKFLSTLSLRRATAVLVLELVQPVISIHALLAESDTFGPARLASGAYFYPRSPCGERLRAPNHNSCLRNNFYPRSPCGERQRRQNRLSPNRKISIHALLAESDYDNGNPVAVSDLFLSTLSLRRATRETVPRGGHIIFLSTLSLRRATPRGPSSNTTILYFYPRSPCGERRRRPSSPLHHPYFYPRSPCGERLRKTVPSGGHIIFLSTLSLRRATKHLLII